jgi:hypothetical protein
MRLHARLEGEANAMRPDEPPSMMPPVSPDLPPPVAEAFDQLRRVRAATASVTLTQAAGRNLILAMREAGFTHEDGVMLAFHAVALGNRDAGRS